MPTILFNSTEALNAFSSDKISLEWRSTFVIKLLLLNHNRYVVSIISMWKKSQVDSRAPDDYYASMHHERTEYKANTVIYYYSQAFGIYETPSEQHTLDISDSHFF